MREELKTALTEALESGKKLSDVMKVALVCNDPATIEYVENLSERLVDATDYEDILKELKIGLQDVEKIDQDYGDEADKD